MSLKRLLFTITCLLFTVILCQAQNKTSIKLFRFGNEGDEKPGVLTADGKMLDVSAFGEDYNEKFFSGNGIKRLEEWVVKNRSICPQVPSQTRMASCVARPSKIVAIGLNYEEHIKEGGAATPTEPVIFLKATSVLCGPYDNAIIPADALKMDYEAELAIVIGKKASHVAEDNALDYVAGYTVINDYSERAWQLETSGGQWDKGKSADHFAPLGPYLVTPEDIGDPQHLRIWLTLNGDTMQNANTRNMIFTIKRLISEVSKYMTLLPGDVIATGTPSGVGLGRKPPVYLKPGDVISLGIENIGTQKQTVVSGMELILGKEAYQDYLRWVALGIGGLPHTLEGYRTVKRIGLQMKDPLDIRRIAGEIGKPGDIKTLFNLPKRNGAKPTIAPFAVPHRQMDQHNDTLIRNLQKKIFDAQVADKASDLVYKTSYLERNNAGIFLRDSAAGNPTIVAVSHAEVGHIHPSDGSMHIILSPSDTKEVIEKGWGELHGLAGEGRAAKTYMMIYAPRNEMELEITKKILLAGVKYATHIPGK